MCFCIFAPEHLKIRENLLKKSHWSAKKTVKGPVSIDGTLILSRVLAGQLNSYKFGKTRWLWETLAYAIFIIGTW